MWGLTVAIILDIMKWIFLNLLELLSGINGKFMLTMFPNDLLSEFIKQNNWGVSEVIRTISASKTSRRKQTEIIVCNYD